MDHRTRRRVFERDGGQCVACGSPFMLTIQHRVSKGAGGSKLLDGMENLMVLCLNCNVRLESDADFAQRGREAGWKVHRNRTARPEDTPVLYPLEGVWRYLLPDGSRVTTEAP